MLITSLLWRRMVSGIGQARSTMRNAHSSSSRTVQRSPACSSGWRTSRQQAISRRPA